jgi:para-aminobenzoate synthetase component I
VGWAAFGRRVLTHCVDVTSEPTALDATGTWVVVQPFDGALTCVRMAVEREVNDPYCGAPPWPMPPRPAWSSSLDRDG